MAAIISSNDDDSRARITSQLNSIYAITMSCLSSPVSTSQHARTGCVFELTMVACRCVCRTRTMTCWCVCRNHSTPDVSVELTRLW